MTTDKDDCQLLWQNCRERPDDLLRQLVLADWLDEHGDHESAALFRSPVGRIMASMPKVFSDFAAPEAYDWIGDVMTPDPERPDLDRHKRIIRLFAYAVDDLLHEPVQSLLDHDAVASAIADTNCCGWTVDWFEVWPATCTSDRTEVRVEFYLSGEQDGEDRMFAGDKVSGTVTAVIDADRKVTLADDVRAAVDYGDEEEADEGPDDFDDYPDDLDDYPDEETP